MKFKNQTPKFNTTLSQRQSITPDQICLEKLSHKVLNCLSPLDLVEMEVLVGFVLKKANGNVPI